MENELRRTLGAIHRRLDILEQCTVIVSKSNKERLSYPKPDGLKIAIDQAKFEFNESVDDLIDAAQRKAGT